MLASLSALPFDRSSRSQEARAPCGEHPGCKCCAMDLGVPQRNTRQRAKPIKLVKPAPLHPVLNPERTDYFTRSPSPGGSPGASPTSHPPHRTVISSDREEAPQPSLPRHEMRTRTEAPSAGLGLGAGIRMRPDVHAKKLRPPEPVRSRAPPPEQEAPAPQTARPAAQDVAPAPTMPHTARPTGRRMSATGGPPPRRLAPLGDDTPTRLRKGSLRNT